MPYWKEIKDIQKNFVIGDRSLNGFEHNVLFRNDGGRFTEIGHVAGCDSVYDSRGVIAADLDHDGDLDFLVTALRKPLVLLENQTGNQNNWIELRLISSLAANQAAIGARIKLLAAGKQQMSEVNAGSSFLSQQSPWPFFGLGKASVIDHLEITWPNHQIETYSQVPVNGILSITQGEGRISFKQIGKKPLRPATLSQSPLLSLHDKPASLDDFKGKIVVANFWASWCEPCKREIPILNSLHEKWSDRNVKILGISVEEGAKDRVAEGVWQNGIGYPVYIARKSFLKDFGGIEAIPTTVILDRHGKERFRHSGIIDQAELSLMLEKLTGEYHSKK